MSRFWQWIIDRRLARIEGQMANLYSIVRHEREEDLRQIRLRLFHARKRLQRTLESVQLPK